MTTSTNQSDESRAKLYRMYSNAFDSCMKTIDCVPSSSDDGPANPLVIQPPVDYFASTLKVMYFGQETNGWEGAYKESAGIDHLLNVYDQFANQGGAFKYGGQFWNGIRRFQDAFIEAVPDSNFVWGNLIKIGKDWSKGRPPQSVIDWQEPWFHVIREELRILKPDVVIFLSGPYYDDILERVIGPLEMSEIEGFTARQLVRVHSDILPSHAFRTYHPRYLWQFGLPAVLDAILRFINNAGHSSNSTDQNS